MTIRESVFFNYDGKNSQDMGIYNINLNGGLLEEPFLYERTINEIKTKQRDKPYFQNIERTPLTFTFNFYFENKWDDTKIREVARWLTPDYYKPFYFNDNPNRIFYCMPVGESTLLHNGLKEGYVTITMRCDSPYSYSPVKTSANYKLQYNSGGTSITINNDGDTRIYPEIWIKKLTSNGDVTISSLSSPSGDFKFTGLTNQETIYIDNENEYIETNTVNTYRYSSFNGNYLSFDRGSNLLTVYGDCEIQFRYQFKLLQ